MSAFDQPDYLNIGDEFTVCRTNYVDALRARVAELEAMTTWQPISIAPENDEAVLIYIDKVYIAWRPNPMLNIWNCPELGGRIKIEPTHWMPLPKPPEVE